jgi:hypothetical protein
MARNLLQLAKKVPTNMKVSSKSKDEIEIAGLERYAVLDHAIKILEAEKKVAGGEIKAGPMLDNFVELGCKMKRRPPESLTGYEGEATANLQMKQRSSASTPSDIEQKLCAKYGIILETVVVQPEAFLVNPKYNEDMVVLNEANRLLGASKKIPSDIFLKQDAVERVIVPEQALDKIFTKEMKVAKQLAQVCTTLAIKAKFNGDNEELVTTVRKILKLKD